jgi:hypothetical protein
MPIIIEQGREREVTAAEYTAIQQDVRSERRASIMRPQRDGPAPKALWDCLDESWAGPFPEEMAYKHYLQKVVIKCSACSFRTSFDNGVKRHANQVIEKYENHQGRVVLEQVEGGQVCLACSQRPLLSPRNAEKHVANIIADGPKHKSVEAIHLKLYALEPSEPIVLRSEHVFTAPDNMIGPEAKVERITTPRRRRRRRRRR